jgi:hypothetical protein
MFPLRAGKDKSLAARPIQTRVSKPLPARAISVYKVQISKKPVVGEVVGGV